MRDNVHIRLTLTRGGQDHVRDGPAAQYRRTDPDRPRRAQGPGLRFAADPPDHGSIRRFPPDCMDPKIHHNNLIQSILAKIEANAAGADDALMLDRQGFVAETNTTHVFVVRGGVVTTSHCHACPEE